MLIEDSDFWLKISVLFFRPNHRQLHMIYLTGLTGPSVLGLFTWGLHRVLLQVLLLQFLMIGKGENFKDTFFSFTVFSIFPLLGHLPCTPHVLKVHKTARTFCLGSPKQGNDPCICTYSLDPRLVLYVPFHEENKSGGAGILSCFRFLLILFQKMMKGLTLSILAYCFNQHV